MNPDIQAFFDETTNTVTYVVTDPESNKCAVIDPVLDYDLVSGRISTTSVDLVIGFIKDRSLQVEWILETHVHADHLTAALNVRDAVGGKVCVGEHIADVQQVFVKIFNLDNVSADGSQFDRLLSDGDEFEIGGLRGKVMYTPGHTPACNTYLIGDAAFVGDTLFMPDFGTARCDFPGGDAAVLYESIQKIFALPPETRLFMCHDYKAPGRSEFSWETTVAEQRDNNVHIHLGVSESEFVAFRNERDASLGLPKLMIPSIQVNICAGALPDAEGNGTRYLKTPIDKL